MAVDDSIHEKNPVTKPALGSQAKQGQVPQSILEMAELLFVKQGIQGTSLADIARGCGISKGTLFYHFPSKDDLVMHIASTHTQKITETILASIANGPDQRGHRHHIFELLHLILQARFRNQLHLYLVEESLSRNVALKEELAGKYQEWKTSLEKPLLAFMGERGALVASIVFAMIDGLAIQSLLGLPTGDLGALIDCILGSE